MPPTGRDLQQRIAQRKAIEKKKQEVAAKKAELAKEDARAKAAEKAPVNIEPTTKKKTPLIRGSMGEFIGDYSIYGSGAEGYDPLEGEAALAAFEPGSYKVYADDPETGRLHTTTTHKFAKDVSLNEVEKWYRQTYNAANTRQAETNRRRILQGLEPFAFEPTVMPTRKELARDLARYGASGMPVRTFDAEGRAIPSAGAQVEHAEAVKQGGSNKGSTGYLEWGRRNQSMGGDTKVVARSKGRVPITAIDMKAKPQGLGLKGLGAINNLMSPVGFLMEFLMAKKEKRPMDPWKALSGMVTQSPVEYEIDPNTVF